VEAATRSAPVRCAASGERPGQLLADATEGQDVLDAERRGAAGDRVGAEHGEVVDEHDAGGRGALPGRGHDVGQPGRGPFDVGWVGRRHRVATVGPADRTKRG